MAEDRDDIKKGGVPARFVLAGLLFFATFNSYVYRTNLSLTVVAMVNESYMEPDPLTKTKNEARQCPRLSDDNNTLQSIQGGKFPWTMKTQGFVQGGFFYGYASTQVLSGWLSGQIGTKYLLGGGMFVGSVLTLLTPLLAEMGVGYLIAGRVITGISQSVVFPGLTNLFQMWIPPLERSRMYTVCNAGSNTGLLISMPVIGWLCQHGFAGGWPSVFYVFGSIGILWSVFWFLLAFDSPAKHPRISAEERKYILDSLPKIKPKPVPWVSILTSVPVWAYIFSLATGSWVYYNRLTELPTYLTSALHFPISKNAIVNTVVTAAAIGFSFITGFLADFLLIRKYLTTTQTRKFMEITAQVGCGVCLMAVTLSGCSSTLVVCFLALSAGLLAFSNVGTGVLVMEMAPAFSGTVFGIGNTVSAATGFLTPVVTGLIVTGRDLFHEWHDVFYVSIGLGVLGSLVLLLFGTAEPQKWNFGPEDHQEEDMIPVVDNLVLE